MGVFLQKATPGMPVVDIWVTCDVLYYEYCGAERGLGGNANTNTVIWRS